MRLLMVCLGNICRSPLAEGIMKSKFQQNNLNWSVDSAGTGSWHTGAAPDSRSISIAKSHGVDISDQRARQFTSEDYANFDIIFAMDSSNFQNILKLAPNEESRSKVKLIMNQYQPGMNQSVPDPYWDDDGFQQVFAMLDQACEKFIQSNL